MSQQPTNDTDVEHLKKLSIVKTQSRDLCQTKLFACPIGNLAFKQRVIERGNPFKFAHKLLTKFLKGILQSCQICWHFSLSLYLRRDYIPVLYIVGLKSYSIKMSSNRASTPKTRQDVSVWSLHLFRPWKYEKEMLLRVGFFIKMKTFLSIPWLPKQPRQ